MGCDIHSYAEVRRNGKWEASGDVFPLDDFYKKHYKKECGPEPFADRNYGLFGFLADVRNYSFVPCLAKPKYLPPDISDVVKNKLEIWDSDAHSSSWFSLSELLAVDYDAIFWDKRVTRQISPHCRSGACEAEEGEGRHLSLREFLGTGYFQTIEVLKTLGAPDDVRVVFWFDN